MTYNDNKMNTIFNKNTTMLELKQILGNNSDALMYGVPDWFVRNGNLNYDGLLKKHPDWSIAEMFDCMELFLKTPHQIHWLKDKVGTIALYQGEDHPNMILLAGGGYGSVCTWAEGLPVAMEAYKRGYNVYLPTYSVSEENLFPKPIEDMKDIVSFLVMEYHIKDYVIGGFSAGAHLAIWWGLEDKGAKHYNLPSPKAEILVYPLVVIDDSKDDKELRDLIAKRIGGNPSYYDVDQYITSSFPKTYIVRGKNDTTLCFEHARRLIEKFNQYNISYIYDEYENANHGFGLGGTTDAQGWFDKALKFIEKQEG